MHENTLRKDLTNKILVCQEIIEKIYIEIGGNYSTVMVSLENGLKSSKNFVEHFKHNIFDNNDSVIMSVSKIENKLNSSLDLFRGLDSEAKMIRFQYNENLSQISDIRNQINSVKKMAELMQMLVIKNFSKTITGLNDNETFSSDSQTLQDKALATAKLSDKLYFAGNKLQEDFANISSALVELSDTERDLCNLLEESVGVRFEETNKHIKEFVDFLEALERDALKIRGPLFSIMQNLQYQDILRQSLDHVTLFLNSIEKLTVKNLDENHHKLDVYSLYEMVSEFSISVFYEARDRLNENIKDFESHTVIITDIIKLIDENRLNMIEQYATGNKLYSGGDSVYKLKKNFSKLVKDLVKSVEIKKIITPNKSNFSNILNKLFVKNKEFDEISNDIKRSLSNSESKNIESGILELFDGTYEELNSLISSLDDKVSHLSIGFESLMDAGSDLSNKCKKLSISNSDITNNLKKTMGQLFEFMNKTTIQVVESVDSFSVFSDYFFKLINKSYKSIQSLADYSAILNDSIDISSKMGSDCALKKQLIMKELGYDNWVVENSEILELINRFTLFRHRTKAKELSGVKESGIDVGEGSISLF